MIILGVNFFFEHSSVAVIEDGKLVYSAEEERFSGIKGGKRYSPFSVHFPYKAMYSALNHLDLNIRDVDAIALSYEKWDHLKGLFSKRWSYYDDYYALRGLFHTKRILCSDYETLQYMSDRISSSDLKKVPLIYFDHHLSHAASAYCYSGFEESLVFVADCCGEKSCTSLYIGSSAGLKKIKSFDIPHSLGILYSVVTKHLGFDSFQDEFKVMGLASYGRDTYLDAFKNIITFNEQGDYKINPANMFNLSAYLGPARKKGEEISQRHMDIAKSLQTVLETILLNLFSHYREKTGIRNLCMAGGVALNCVANGKISDAKIFDNIFVQPAASDAGTSMGAAALAYFKLKGKMQISFDNMYLGTEYSNKNIEKLITDSKLKASFLTDEELIDEAAKRMAAGQIGGLFRGRMEAGPRALGNRSVIASPAPTDMLERINHIKGREMFRPIAPIVKEDRFDSFFTGEKNQYMLFTCTVRPEAAHLIPAVTHVDNTSRVQTVTETSNPFVYSLISKFESITGIPVIVNTSLNFRGKPIVENPTDAIGSFYSSGLDFLIIENYLLEK
ncbi:MAG: hypothetical protein IKV72_01560 [Firmicutes bacterium]|nr:hypothetical protein [Bacillota bacterium]MBR5488363.1 hypothetical protein [Bacillota bacterium]